MSKRKRTKSEKEKLYDKLIMWWSWFVRKRDGRCVCCEMRGLYNPVRFNDKGFPISHNNGHFIGGRSQKMSLVFEESNQNCQCVPCNIKHNSDQDDYTKYMILTFGKEEVERLKALKNVSKSYTVEEYKQMLEEIKARYYALPDRH